MRRGGLLRYLWCLCIFQKMCRLAHHPLLCVVAFFFFFFVVLPRLVMSLFTRISFACVEPIQFSFVVSLAMVFRFSLLLHSPLGDKVLLRISASNNTVDCYYLLFFLVGGRGWVTRVPPPPLLFCCHLIMLTCFLRETTKKKKVLYFFLLHFLFPVFFLSAYPVYVCAQYCSRFSVLFLLICSGWL